ETARKRYRWRQDAGRIDGGGEASAGGGHQEIGLKRRRPALAKAAMRFPRLRTHTGIMGTIGVRVDTLERRYTQVQRPRFSYSTFRTASVPFRQNSIGRN